MKCVVAFLLVALVLGSCGVSETAADARVVSIETTACGDASRTSGAGVVVENGWVMVSAHVLAGAGSVTVTRLGDAVPAAGDAEIVVFDAAADLALLRVPGATASPVRVAGSNTDDVVTIAGGGPSDPTDTTILRGVEVRIEAVRSEERISRIGYEVDVRVELGDSGAGVYNEADQLIGIVFGRAAEDEDRSFVVGQEAISTILTAERSGLWTCDATQHRIAQDPH